MNTVLNDQGERVLAVGALGSKQRAAVEYPRLIAVYQGRYNQTCGLSQPYSWNEAMDDLERQEGIKSKLVRSSILANTDIT